jgi:uncharacterized membrane protein YedE/YeeE
MASVHHGIALERLNPSRSANQSAMQRKVAKFPRQSGEMAAGEAISIPPKRLQHGIRYALGGTIFGLGWAFTGACPGPLFALVGNGVTVMIVAIASALAGTWLYGLLRPKLPH